jgi:hypothetical protein
LSGLEAIAVGEVVKKGGDAIVQVLNKPVIGVKRITVKTRLPTKRRRTMTKTTTEYGLEVTGWEVCGLIVVGGVLYVATRPATAGGLKNPLLDLFFPGLIPFWEGWFPSGKAKPIITLPPWMGGMKFP